MEQLKSKNLCAFDNYHLRLNPRGLNGTYGCSVFFDDGQSKNEIRYKLDISFTGNVENEIRTYRIERDSNIYVNDQKPDGFIDKLAFEVSECLYPIDVKTSKKGKLIKILNFEEIVLRWGKRKELINEKYKSELTIKYIEATEKSLKSEDVFLEKISKDWFLKLYFDSLYKFYSEDLYVNESVCYPIVGNIKPIGYQVKSKIQLQEDTNDIRLEIKGNINDDRSALDIEQKLDYSYYKTLDESEKGLKGECNLIYLFKGNTGIIEAIEAEFNTEFSKPKKILVKLFLLKELTRANSFVVENEDEAESKSGFWSRLFKK